MLSFLPIIPDRLGPTKPPTTVIWQAQAQPAETARQLIEQGDRQAQQGNRPQAIAAYQQAIIQARQAQDRPSIGLGLGRIGRTLLDVGQTVEAEHLLFVAMQELEVLPPGQTDIFSRNVYHTLEDTYQHLQRALVINKKVEAALVIAERHLDRTWRANQHPFERRLSWNIPHIQQEAQRQNAAILLYSWVSTHQMYYWMVYPTGQIQFREVAWPRTTNLPDLARRRDAAAVASLNQAVITAIEDAISNSNAPRLKVIMSDWLASLTDKFLSDWQRQRDRQQVSWELGASIQQLMANP